jgi:hypothetical protein
MIPNRTAFLFTGLLLVMSAWLSGTARAAVLYQEAVLADNPSIYLRLDETSGAVADNLGSLGSAADGAYGAGIALGQPGAAVNTDTSVRLSEGDRVVINNNFDPSNYTIEMWVKLDADYTAERNLFSHVTKDWGGSNKDSWVDQLRINSSGYFEHNTVDSGPRLATSSVQAQAGQWYHLVGVYTSTSATDIMQLYINGTLAAQSTGNFNAPVSTPSQWIVGGSTVFQGYYNYQPMAGQVDEVAVYDHALSSDQILAHYNAASLVPEPSSILLLVLGGWLAWMVRDGRFTDIRLNS